MDIDDPAARKLFLTSACEQNGEMLIRLEALLESHGRSLLMLAVSSDEVPVETVETLIGLRADLNGTAADGKTALDFARRTGRTPIVELLEKAGAKTGRDEASPVLRWTRIGRRFPLSFSGTTEHVVTVVLLARFPNSAGSWLAQPL